jgi:hypothetical protein
VREAAGDFIAPVVVEVAGVTADVFPLDQKRGYKPRPSKATLIKNRE